MLFIVCALDCAQAIFKRQSQPSATSDVAQLTLGYPFRSLTLTIRCYNILILTTCQQWSHTHLYVLAAWSHAGINNILGTWLKAGPAFPVIYAALGDGFQHLCLAYEPAEIKQEGTPLGSGQAKQAARIFLTHVGQHWGLLTARGICKPAVHQHWYPPGIVLPKDRMTGKPNRPGSRPPLSAPALHGAGGVLCIHQGPPQHTSQYVTVPYALLLALGANSICQQ